jgi:prepilin-type N-terminal cleavage/methylation domain-containing protein
MVKTPRSARDGFTFVELLIVIAVISILAGMLLAAAGPIREAVKKSKTRTIVADIQLAMATISGDAAYGSPVEHPLAGSSAKARPRPIFVRAADGSTVDDTAPALVISDPALLPLTDRKRVLMPDDRYQGSASPDTCPLPLLFGVQRSRIRILGATSDAITTYRRLPGANSEQYVKASNQLKQPYDNSLYPDREYLVSPVLASGQTLETESKDALEKVLSQYRSEILQKGGLFTADPADGAWICEDRAWRPNAGITASATGWKPGFVLDGGTWKRYRLRGTALYDAWGNEILCSIQVNDAVRVESAGRDGVFRWHPGADGKYQTAANDPVPAGDDRDGERDNVSAGTLE